MAEGHPDAWDYTVGQVWQEAAIVVARRYRQLADLSSIMRLTISSLPDMAITPEGTQQNFDRYVKAIDNLRGA